MTDRVVAAARASRQRRYSSWHDSLPRDEYEELVALKESLNRGDVGLSARSLAKAIIDDMAARGYDGLPTTHTVSQWLLAK